MPSDEQISLSYIKEEPLVLILFGLAQAVVAAYTCPMRIVGEQNRSEIELDPVKAYRRGKALDAMFRNAAPQIVRGVTRGSHAYFNRQDAERQKQAARAQ